MAAETRAAFVSGLHLVYWSSCWRGRAVLTRRREGRFMFTGSVPH